MNTEEMNSKLMDALDSSTEYSLDDFNAEYNNVNTTANVSTYKIPLKFVNKSVNKDNDSGKNQNPEYAKDGDSGFDVRANVSETISLMSTRLSVRKTNVSRGGTATVSVVDNVELIHGETKVIPTGLFFEIPKGYEIQVRSRSGLSAKVQVVVLNAPGTLDSGYRGELKIILTNFGTEVLHIKNGDRIAQCVFTNVIDNSFINLEEVSEISEDTDRGTDGFGSTGVK